MVNKKLKNIPLFIAGDGTHLREVLHPKNDPVNLPFSIAHASVPVGGASLLHTLKESETYYFISGHGEIVVGGESKKVGPGHVVVVPPKANQHVVNESEVNLEFLCIVSPPWTEDGEEIL